MLYRAAAAPVREHIVRNGLLRGVVLLPHAMLKSTGVQTAILILANRRNNDNVVFMDASQLYSRGGRNNELLPEAADLILSAYHTHSDTSAITAGGSRFMSRAVTYAEINSNSFNLHVDNYIH